MILLLSFMCASVGASSTLSQRLWRESKQEAERSLSHPFVVGLGTGSLSVEAFQSYIIQDWYFLHAFAKGYAYALVLCNQEHLTDFWSMIGCVG
ncbi:unnamed protein product [Chrysoparadoxa australica]